MFNLAHINLANIKLLKTYLNWYFEANICWYQKPDGSWGFFLQDEGFTQGCSLSPYFSCQVLHPVLAELHDRLQQRNGDMGDDGNGSSPAMGSYLDDTGAALPYVDCKFAILTFQELGAPHGLLLSLDKTKILTTLNPEVSVDHPDLSKALKLLKLANCLTRGTVYLSAPFGSRELITEQLDLAADACF